MSDKKTDPPKEATLEPVDEPETGQVVEGIVLNWDFDPRVARQYDEFFNRNQCQVDPRHKKGT